MHWHMNVWSVATSVAIDPLAVSLTAVTVCIIC